jgi:hypothetical protein
VIISRRNDLALQGARQAHHALQLLLLLQVVPTLSNHVSPAQEHDEEDTLSH